MAKVIQICAADINSQGYGTSRYHNIANSGWTNSEGIEANRQITYRTAGTLSLLYIYISTNNLNGTSTFKTRKNGGDGSMSISINGSATGDFEETEDTDSVSVGEEWGVVLVAGGSSGTILARLSTTVFDASSDTVIRHAAINFPNFGGDPVQYYGISDDANGLSNTTEGRARFDVGTSGTFQNLFVYISVNDLSTASDIKFRVDGADGNMSISIGSGQTGIFEDTENTDSVVEGNDVNYSLDGGTGSNFIAEVISVEWVSTTNKFHSVWGRSVGIVDILDGETKYLPFGGDCIAQISEANVDAAIQIPATVSDLCCYSRYNSCNGITDVYVRKDGTNTAVTVEIPAYGTGQYNDTSNSVEITASEEVNYAVAVGGSSGGMEVTLIGVLVENTESGTSHTKNLTDEMSVSDSFAKTGVSKMLLTDDISLAESISQELNLNKSLTTTISLLESLSDETSQGSRSPGTMSDDSGTGTVVWATPDNAKVNDGSYTTAQNGADSPPVYSHHLKATNFGFSIPDGATINGILVQIEENNAGSLGAMEDETVKIIKADASIGAENKANVGISWTNMTTYTDYGANDDLWSESWTPANINDSDFGVALSIQINSNFVSGRVDHIQITVYYTEGGASHTKTLTETVSIADSLPKIFNIEKTLIENLSLEESLNTESEIDRSLDEILLLSTSSEQEKTVSTIQSDTVSLLDDNRLLIEKKLIDALDLSEVSVFVSPPLISWSDDFDDNVININKWRKVVSEWNNAAEQNNRLEITSTASGSAIIRTVGNYDLRDTQMVINVTQHSTDGGFKICKTYGNGANWPQWDIYEESNWYNYQTIAAGAVRVIRKKNDASSTLATSGALTTPYWLRINISSGTIYFDYVDNQAETPVEQDWVNLTNEVWDLGDPLTALFYLWFTAYNTPTTGSSFLDNFNWITGTDHIKDLDETIILSDLFTAESIAKKELSENINLSEIFGKSSASQKNFTESLATTDAFSKKGSVVKDDIVDFLDIETKGLSKIFLESLNLLESKASESGTQKTLSEILSLTEQSDAADTLRQSLSDWARLSERLQFIDVSRYSTLPHVMSFSDGLRKDTSLLKLENIILIESIRVQAGLSLSEILILSELIKRTEGRSFDDSLIFLDNLSKTSVHKRQLLDSIILSALLKSKTGLSLTDSLNLLDSFDFVTGTTTFVSDSLEFTEFLLKQTTLSKNEVLSLIDSFSTISTVSRTLTDILNLVDALKKDRSVPKTDSLLLTENFLKSVDLSKSEILSFLSSNPVFDVSKFFFQIVSLSEAKIITTDFIRQFSDSVSLAEALEKISKLTFSEALILAETFLKVFEIKQDLVETLTLIESYLKDVKIKKVVSFELIESQINEIDIREIEILVLSDELQVSRANRLLLTDTFSLIEILIKEIGLTFQEALSLIDILAFVEKEGIPQKTVLVTRKKQTISLTKGRKTYLFFKQ